MKVCFPTRPPCGQPLSRLLARAASAADGHDLERRCATHGDAASESDHEPDEEDEADREEARHSADGAAPEAAVDRDRG